jgi:spermidine/putrescine transport system substrate-binding protein
MRPSVLSLRLFAKENMMRRTFFLLFLILFAVLPFVALAQDAAPEPWVCPEGYEGQSLSVYNWSTYIAENTISNFEALCGVTVSYDVFASNEDLLTRLRQSNPGYDVVVPTDYMVETMIGEGLLEPLNLDNIPNLANISPDLLDQVFDPGNVYSVPYQWGTVGVGYNNTVVDEIVSWEDVWNYDGPVAWIEDQRAMINIALNNLGITPAEATEDDIALARDYLMDNGGNMVAIALDDGQALLERGDVDIAIEYNGDILQLNYNCECEDYTYVIPEEGSSKWMDNLAIPYDAPNHALAEVFLDYILDPQVGANISNYTAYGSPNQTAIDLGLIDEALLNNPGIYPSEEIRARLYQNPNTPDLEVAYSAAWDEIRVFLGQ